MITYNGASYVHEQLHSIASQSRLPDELIICDDGSNDGTPRILEMFAMKAPFPVRLVFNEKNLGYVKNSERAIRMCTGEIIFLADQDDIWLPEKVAYVEKVFSRFPRAGIVFSNAEIVDQHLRPLGYDLWQKADFNRSRQRRLAQGSAFEELLKGNVVYGTTMAFRSSFKGLILPISSNWDADEWIALLISSSAGLVALNYSLVKYRQHSNNLAGAPKGTSTLREHLAKVRQPDRRVVYSNTAEQYALLRQRLREASRYGCNLKRVQLVEDKYKHLRSRAEMDKGLFARVPKVLGELVTLRYHRCSGGWRAIIKDILFLT
jgi:glycosyltransferase involved in cell wall biosynthesis